MIECSICNLTWRWNNVFSISFHSSSSSCILFLYWRFYVIIYPFVGGWWCSETYYSIRATHVFLHADFLHALMVCPWKKKTFSFLRHTPYCACHRDVKNNDWCVTPWIIIIWIILIDFIKKEVILREKRTKHQEIL